MRVLSNLIPLAIDIGNRGQRLVRDIIINSNGIFTTFGRSINPCVKPIASGLKDSGNFAAGI